MLKTYTDIEKLIILIICNIVIFITLDLILFLTGGIEAKRTAFFIILFSPICAFALPYTGISNNKRLLETYTKTKLQILTQYIIMFFICFIMLIFIFLGSTAPHTNTDIKTTEYTEINNKGE